MKKYFSNTSYIFLIFTLIFVFSSFIFHKTTFSQAPCFPEIESCPPTDLGNTPKETIGNTTGGSLITLDNPFKGGNSLFELLKSIMNDIVLPIGGVLAVLAFIYSGFLYVTAQGNEEQLKTAHKALLYTSIGTAILLGSWVLVNVICETIGQLGGPACST